MSAGEGLAAALGPGRFLREITTAASLAHPHIVPVHDSGEAGGFLYYVMPFVPGESLRDKLSHEGELPVADAVRILRDLADAMAYAHQQGVVHRDIKSEKYHKAVEKYVAGYATLDDAGAAAFMDAHLARDTRMNELRKK